MKQKVRDAPQGELLPKAKRTLVTKSEFARLVEVSPASVTKAIAQGRISVVLVNGRELLDPVESLASWRARTRSRIDVQLGDDSPSAAPSVPARDPGRPDELRQARQRMEHAQAELAEHRVAVLRGELVERRAVEFVLRELAAAVHDGFGSFPDRVAPSLVDREQSGIRAVLVDELEKLQRRIGLAVEKAGNIQSQLTFEE